MSSRDRDITNPALAGAGRARIEWAAGEMPVLAGLRQRFAEERPLDGLGVGGCLHITTETANQALAVAHMAAHGAALEPAVHPVPAEIDREVARLKLAAMGLAIARVTAEQEHYLSSWQEGT